MKISGNQVDLFEKKLISTIGYDQHEIIRDILRLHCGGNYIECDPTYSTGNFYEGYFPRPKYMFDLKPQVSGVIEADARKLPLTDNEISVMMFDPPFIARTSKLDSCLTANRFGSFTTMDECWKFYDDSLKEFYRVMKMEGVLIFKCQDNVDNHKNYFSHVQIMNYAVNVGFYPLDLFILLARHRMDNGTQNQEHARKFHSYFWVFRKQKSKVNYATL